MRALASSVVVGRSFWAAALCSALGVAACESLDPAPADDPWSRGTGAVGGGVIHATGGTGGKSGGLGKGGGIGFDSRPVVTAARTPPPISGGTLLVLKEGGRAVVSDQDRDLVSVVNLTSQVVEVSFPFDAATEPGRLVEDAHGRVHVALRGTGDLLTIDTRENTAVDRRPVCRAPRGMAYDPTTDRIVVACQEGTLVELPAGEGAAVRSTQIGQDLRDVVLLDGQLVVTRFRAAELIYLDADRKVTTRVKPPTDELGFAASVAWRAVASPEGNLIVAHQRAFSGVIDIGGDSGVAGQAGASGEPGEAPGAGGEPAFEVPTRSGYGNSEPCSSVVEGTLAFASTNGTVQIAPCLERMVLPVDVAVMHGIVAVANAGASALVGGPGIGLFTEEGLRAASPEASSSLDFVGTPGQVVAVAFDPVSGRLIAQTREPAQLLVVFGTLVESVVQLSDTSVFDTGHEMFHADSGAGIACASCHPEGAEDGHVWRFSGFGDRRTQPLDVGLEGTAPVHWDGELTTFSHLMQSVFRDRMAGPLETPERELALEEYVYRIPRRTAVRDAGDTAALRGKALFESKDVGCTECHSGPKFTNGESENIGREAALQVPSLIAVSARAPFMHDGCAETLLDRFDPTCGGSRHGRLEGLEASDLQDLVAYLETL